MLRVRPILLTSRLDDYSALLTALGMECTENQRDWRLFDTANGKVGLHGTEAGSADDGTTNMGFELRDREVFVRRTLEDGTRAELVDSLRGPAARVTAPDGYSFLADPVTDANITAPGPLTVVQLWRTPDVAAARKVLADIGARPCPDGPDGYSCFRAKNGGLVEVRPGEVTGVVLGLEYDGDLAALGARLGAAGFSATKKEGSLAVRTPDGTTLRILAARTG